MSNQEQEIKKKFPAVEENFKEAPVRNEFTKQKTWVEILSSLSPLISGVLIAAVGTAATILYNNRQMQLNHLDALDKYRPYLTSDNPVERKFGYRVYVDLGYEDLVVELIGENADPAGFSILKQVVSTGDSGTTQLAEYSANSIMANAIPQEQKKIPEPVLSTVTNEKKEGWAYLGHYQENKKKWITHYFDFEDTTSPNALVDKRLVVRVQTGDLNVRSSPPTISGKFGSIVDVLKPGSNATVREVQQWYSSGYMWARITYGT